MGGGAVGNFQAVHQCIARPSTYPKFTTTQANLLIIADDLNLSLHDTLFQVEKTLPVPTGDRYPPANLNSCVLFWFSG